MKNLTIKDKISISLSIIALIMGYFFYEYMIKINPNYALISLIIIMSASLAFFSTSSVGKRFWMFFKDVKIEFSKINFPKTKEVSVGLAIVLTFSTTFMFIIAAMDHLFLMLYNSLM